VKQLRRLRKDDARAVPTGALALQQSDPIKASVRVVSFRRAPALRGGHDERHEPRLYKFYFS